MKKAAIIFGMFALGALTGWTGMPAFLQWLIAPSGGQLIITGPRDIIQMHSIAPVMWGVLFAVAAGLARSLRSGLLLLVLGLSVSAAVALDYRNRLAATRANLFGTDLATLRVSISPDSLPLFQIPLLGTSAIIVAAFAFWLRRAKAAEVGR